MNKETKLMYAMEHIAHLEDLFEDLFECWSLCELDLIQIKILEKKSFKKVVIAGHSMGTRLAIDIASKIKNIRFL